MGDVMQDDYNGVMLRWVVNNKWGEEEWMCNTMAELKRNPGGQYSSWVDWETFVRAEVKEGRLKEDVLTMVRDGGGKPKPKKPKKKLREEIVMAESPQKKRLETVKKCQEGDHDFWEEGRASVAKKGSGAILDGMILSLIHI